LQGKNSKGKSRTIFKDPVHNIISVNEYEYAIIQHPIINRLHGIKQLGFTYYVYPQAKHSRFEHSLGVMHIAGKIADAIASNAPDKLSELLRSRCGFQDFRQVVRLVGLLHDVGHLPYSHITETLLTEAATKGDVSEKMARVLNEAENLQLKPHEYYSCLFARKLSSEAKKWSKEYRKLSRYLASASHVLCGEGVGDSILSPLGTEIIRRIISEDILDADRMDYLARDAYNTGSTYGIIDIDRIISGISLTQLNKEIAISIPSKLLSSIEELYYARYMMYKWVYLHHKVISLDLTYKSFLLEVSKNWEEIRRKLSKLLPLIPNNFWDVFLPSTIWNSSVKYGFKIDDSFIDLIMKISVSSKMEDLSSLSRGLLDRRLPLYSVIKREEDVITALSTLVGDNESDNFLDAMDALGKSYKAVVEGGTEACKSLFGKVVPLSEQCCFHDKLPNEALSCLAQKYIESFLDNEYPFRIQLTVYVTPPISSSKLPSKIVLVSNKHSIPLTKSSVMLKETLRLGLRPLIYVYSKEKPNDTEKERIKVALASFLIDLNKALEAENKKDEGIHSDDGMLS